jgi:hypothetical protein
MIKVGEMRKIGFSIEGLGFLTLLKKYVSYISRKLKT